MYFRTADAPKLWDLARRHCADTDDLSKFAQAARSTERGEPLVIECIDKWQLEAISAFFARWGIEPPRIEELRVDGR